MKKICNHRRSQVSYEYMRIAILIGSLCIGCSALAQSSAALDENYIQLQSAQTFKGYYQNAGAGAFIKNMGIMAPGEKFGSVFLNSIDTLGYGSTVIDKRPLGLFLGGPDFSLFNRSKFRLNASNALIAWSRGKDSLPILIENGSYQRIRYPHKAYDYDTSDFVYLAYQLPNQKPHPVGSLWSIGSGFMDKDSMEDIAILVGESDSLMDLFVWNNLEYKGDTVTIGINGLYKIIPQTQLFSIAGNIAQYEKAQFLDVNNDAIPDLIFLQDTVIQGIHSGSKHLHLILGKRANNGKWAIDTSIEYYLPYSINFSNILFMDFLWSDGIPDLILHSEDTIYCYSGNKKDFLRTPLDWLHPDLAIPNPEMVDTINFKGNGKGSYDFVLLSDAGNVNGSGEHSLAVLGAYTPNLQGFDATSYCMLYSGGKAADEKADAIFADNTMPSGYFQRFDTIQSGLTTPMNMLIGDPYYDQGGVGKLYFVKGRAQIPHTADPRWMTEVKESNKTNFLTINLLANPVVDNAMVVLQGDGRSNGLLIVRDLLGRAVFSRKIFSTGRTDQREQIDLSSLSAGIYFIEFSQNHNSAVVRMLKLMGYSALEPTPKRLLPEAFYYPPFICDECSMTEQLRWDGMPMVYTSWQIEEIQKVRKKATSNNYEGFAEAMQYIIDHPNGGEPIITQIQENR